MPFLPAPSSPFLPLSDSDYSPTDVMNGAQGCFPSIFQTFLNVTTNFFTHQTKVFGHVTYVTSGSPLAQVDVSSPAYSRYTMSPAASRLLNYFPSGRA